MSKLVRITFRIFDYCLVRFILYFSKEMDEEVLRMQTDEIVSRARLLDNEIKVRSFVDLTGNSRPSLFLSYIYCGGIQLHTISCINDLFGSI